MHNPPAAPDDPGGPGDAVRPPGPARSAGIGADTLLADGAAQPPGRDGVDGPAPAHRRRRRRRWPDLLAAMVFALAGVLFAAGAMASRDGDLRVDTTGGLRSAIQARASQNVQLQAEIDELGARVAALQANADAGPALEATQGHIAELEPAVGLTEVRGPGIRVVLDDADPPDPIPDGMTGDDYIVHQEDVQGVVNALWRGGASGVTVMGQRLISTSAVRCVGNTVILHGRVYSPPFVIEAVGDLPQLEGSLEADPAVRFFREWADVVGMRYEQTTERRMVLPPYSGPLSAGHAQVVS